MDDKGAGAKDVAPVEGEDRLSTAPAAGARTEKLVLSDLSSGGSLKEETCPDRLRAENMWGAAGGLDPFLRTIGAVCHACMLPGSGPRVFESAARLCKSLTSFRSMTEGGT